MKPNTDNDRRSINGMRRGKPCGRPIPVVRRNAIKENEGIKVSDIVKAFAECSKEVDSIFNALKALTLSQDDLNRIVKDLDDRRWATDPLELMDKFERSMASIVKFLDILSA